MNFTYFRFLGRSLSKKWYIWILLIVYIAVSAAFLLLVPTLLKTAPWDFWGNTTILPQDMLMFIGALLSAVLGIAIFRDYSDDGTELIIVSKPINRTKIIVTKFVMFVTFSAGFASLSIFVDLGTFAFQSAQDNPSLVGSLILSTIISNFIFTLVFGFLAILISLFMNKVWTIILNIIIVTLLTIYSMVTLVVAKNPSQVASDHTSYVNTIKYINNGGSVDMAAALSPIDVNNLQNPLAFDNVTDQITKWGEYTKDSGSKSVLPLNLILQFTQMNNMFGLKNYQEEQALDYFDYSRAYSYNFNNELVADRNDPNTLPMFIPTIGRIDYPQWVDPPTNPTDFINWFNKMFPEILATYMQYETNQNITVVGNSHNSSANLMQTVTNIKQYNSIIGQAYYGWNDSNNDITRYTYDELDKQTSVDERNLFHKIIKFFEWEPATKIFLAYWNGAAMTTTNRTHPQFTPFSDQTVWKDRLIGDDQNGIKSLFANATTKPKIDQLVSDIEGGRIGTTEKPINNIYDFLHLILLSNGAALSSYKIAKYRNDKAGALLETMMKLRLAWFKEISNKFRENLPDLESAANTPTDINISVPGTDTNFNFNVGNSPILPLASSTINGVNTYLQDPGLPGDTALDHHDIWITYKSDVPNTNGYNEPSKIELKLDKVMWNGKQLADLVNERMAIDGRVGDPDLYEYFSNIQSLDALLTFNTLTNIVFPDKHMKWEDWAIPPLPSPWGGTIDLELENIDDPWQSPFFGTNTIDEINGQNSDIWMDRAIVDFLGQSEKYGWENGTDPKNFNRNTRYTGTLYTDSSMNYPIMYQNLMSTYHATPNMQNGYIVLGWFCCGIVLMSLCLVVFVRKDFK